MNEVALLRRALAYEAFVLQSFLLYSSTKIPEHMRQAVQRQINRLRTGARGNIAQAYADIPAEVFNMAINELHRPPEMTTDCYRINPNTTGHRFNPK